MSRSSDDTSKHDAIMKASRELFAEAGPRGVSFRKVAARAGCSVGTVQYYFSSIDQLLDALTDPWHDDLTQLLQRTATRLPLSKDRETVLVEMCVDIYRLALQHREALLARRLDTLERGGLLERRRSAALKLMERGAILAAKWLGGDVVRWQLTMQSVEHLIVGFALSPRVDAIGASEDDVAAFLRDAIRGMGRRALRLDE